MLLLAWPAAADAYLHHVHTYTETEGLPNQSVYGVDQTADGRMWIATRQGLVVYDGHAWTDETPAVIDGRTGLRGVVVDDRDRLWVANLLTPPQVAWREDGVWRALPSVQTDTYGWEVGQFTVAEGPDGTTWVAITTANRRLVVWDGAAWTVHREGTGAVYCLEHHRGRFFLASANGLWSIPLERGGRLEPVEPLAGRACYAVAPTPDGGLWTVGDGYAVLTTAAGEEIPHAFPAIGMDEFTYGVVAAAAPEGGFYFGTPWELLHFRPGRATELLDRDSGLASDGASDIFIDREDNVWVCSMRGLSKIVSRHLRSLDHRHGLLEDEVSSLLRLRDGRLLLGHDGGVTVLGDTVRTLPLPEIPHLRSRVMDLAQAPDGTVWAAAGLHGLMRLDPDGAVAWQPPRDGPENAVYAVMPVTDGTVWVGGNDGLGRLVGDRFEAVPLPDNAGDRKPFVRRLTPAADGGFYVMTGRGGVAHRRAGVWRSWPAADTPGGSSTYCALERPDGAVWIGTLDGVMQLAEGGRLVPVPALANLVDRPVYAMVDDAMGRVWLGTDEGMRIWDGESLASVRVGDGLVGPETNRDALLLDADGTVWVGTDRGVTLFDPGYLARPRAEPLVEFLGFDVDGVWVPASRSERRRGSVSLLVARFRGLSFVDEHRIRFRTWLEGFEDDWQPAAPSPLRELRYTNLPPGSYRFHVQAVGTHGERSAVAVSGPVHVVPSVVHTWCSRRAWPSSCWWRWPCLGPCSWGVATPGASRGWSGSGRPGWTSWSARRAPSRRACARRWRASRTACWPSTARDASPWRTARRRPCWASTRTSRGGRWTPCCRPWPRWRPRTPRRWWSPTWPAAADNPPSRPPSPRWAGPARMAAVG
jgi:ligand-binding sensor domain-containing protein